ncbi:hypothetical protein K474DRAFT_1774731 [Panus rudis PR-1116 ss-1]|nr:hypothetical protein K474DRAFT_1774731 [Panus rudis PR-1116 ss-1]
MDDAGQVLSLSVPGEQQRSLPTRDRSIYVRESYVETCKYIWGAATWGMDGALIRGQPGIGKTVFIWYMLIRLLQQHQMVLLHMPDNCPLLFFGERVYARVLSPPPLEQELRPLPKCVDEKVKIWSLVDVVAQQSPPPLATFETCFIVQAPPPNPEHYQEWLKTRPFTFLGALPLWTRQELWAAYVVPFVSTREQLEASASTDPKWVAKPQLTLLTRHHGLMDALRATYSAECPSSVDSMLDVIMDAAIDSVGLIPRSVYAAMLDFTTVSAERRQALMVTSDELRHMVEVFLDWKHFSDTKSHRIIAINPKSYYVDGTPTWAVAFVSRMVAKLVAERLAREENMKARELFSLFKNNPAAASLAGSLFEPLAHHALVSTEGDTPWSLYHMERTAHDDENQPTFQVNHRTPAALSFPKVQRRQEVFGDLPVSLEHCVYYTPRAINFPLIDGFTVDIDTDSLAATLWLVQMTTADEHSSRGYAIIRKLGSILLTQLRTAGEGPPKKRARRGQGEGADEPEPSVNIHYLLVSPGLEPNTQYTWKMPSGWSETVDRVTHQGDMYLLEVPVDVQR